MFLQTKWIFLIPIIILNGYEFLRIQWRLKGTLAQIWKSANIFAFTWKYYVEDFTLKHFLRFDISALKICEKFVYKHIESIEYAKN